MTDKPLKRYFDHTLLKPEATEKQIERLCTEAEQYEFYSVCVNGCYTSFAKELLKDSDVKVCTVIGFPLGACTTETKIFEAKQALEAGADELDMVMNVGKFKSGCYDYCQEEMSTIVKIAKEYNAIVKVIIETCLLSDIEIFKAALLVKDSGAAFVKTSTGFGREGATVHTVELIKAALTDSDVKIKAAGGIRDYDTCMALIEAGADRLGASGSVSIVDHGDLVEKLLKAQAFLEQKLAEKEASEKDIQE